MDSICYSGPSPSLTLEADKSWLRIYTDWTPPFLVFLHRLAFSRPIILWIRGRQLSILSLPYRRSVLAIIVPDITARHLSVSSTPSRCSHSVSGIFLFDFTTDKIGLSKVFSPFFILWDFFAWKRRYVNHTSA